MNLELISNHIIQSYVLQLCIYLEKTYNIQRNLIIKKWNLISGTKIPLFWYLYIIESKNGWYTGITTCVSDRFKKHCSGKGAKYLKGKKCLKLIFQKMIGTHSMALKEEYRVKNLTKKNKLKYIQNNL
ncbi:GIY-YIG domain protein [Invertebrate iridescent virus 30]|uniref:GIY-YIG domain protein n=1 Tax=Invertebrate iridescent virus 30 TaxID=345585 RepID=W8W2Y1_9VIRU|nr:GIY-YIG domain protein [Invertebrate iridescent virus 30]CCV02329.1 GIY-YIG domain protein [Invertebrate iridescent virus 30]